MIAFEMIRVFFRIAFLSAFLGVTAASLTPGTYVPEIHIWDKWLHLVAYAALALLAAPAFEGWGARWRTAVGLGVWGGLLELAQLTVPGRSGEWLDAAVNALGVVIGLLLVQLAERVRKRARAAR